MTKEYEDLIQKTVHCQKLYSMKENDLYDLLYESKALLFNGHFELLSLLHSDTFLRFAHIAQRPWLMSKISKEMCAWIHNTDIGKIDAVLGTSRAGKWFAYDIARELNEKSKTRAVYAKTDPETGHPLKKLIEGFILEQNERVLIVNDLSTTGESLKRLIELTESFKAKIVGLCVFATRTNKSNSPEYRFLNEIKQKYKDKFHYIIELDIDSWPADTCDLCIKKGMPFVRSTDLNSLISTVPIKEVLKPLKHLRVA